MLETWTTILLGNGPNRLSEAKVSWKDVLRQVVKMAPSRNRKIDIRKPLPLLFDEVALAMERQRTGGPGELKRTIAEAMRPLSPNSVHKRLMGLRFPHVLTTNYDYALELAAPRPGNPPFSPKVSTTEARFSLFRHRDTGSSRVWHIHGEIDYPRTIQLGYEHYGSYLARMHRYLTGGNRDETSPFVRGITDFETHTSQYSWIDVFLRNDVHLLGLAFDFSEIDLWWLLIYKERLRCKSRFRVGATFYHHIHVGSLKPNDRTRLSMFEGLGVKTNLVEIDGEWEFAKAYHAILSDLNKPHFRAPNIPLHPTVGSGASRRPSGG